MTPRRKNAQRKILTLLAGLALGTGIGLAARASVPPEMAFPDTAQRSAVRTAPETLQKLMTPDTIARLIDAAQEGEDIFAGPVALSPLGFEEDYFPPDTALPFPVRDGDTLENLALLQSEKNGGAR